MSTVSSKPTWGPTTITDLDSFENYASATAFGAMILGSNALYKAIGSEMKFKYMNKDYGQYQGIAYQILQGYGRADFWNRDDGTAGQYLVNDSSAIVITSAQAPAY